MDSKKLQRIGLDTLPVTFVDTTDTSPNYFDVVYIPSRFTAGKNLIKLKGNSATLLSKADVFVEVLDSINNPLFFEVLDYQDDDGTVCIQVNVDENTAPGNCTIYIATRAINIPELGLYNIPPGPGSNIKWKRFLAISPTTLNSNELLFVSGSLPKINIKESINPYFGQSYKNQRLMNVTGSSTVKLIVPGTTKKSLKRVGTTTGQNRIGTNFLYKVIQPNPLIGNSRENAISTLPLVVENNTLPTLQITSGNFVFSSSMVGGTITVNNPIIDTANGNIITSASYTAVIVNVLNETNAHVSDDLQLVYNGKGYREFLSSPFTCSYVDTPIFTPSENYQSYIDVDIHNIRPATGDVYKIRTYMRPVGSAGEYRMINETVLSQQDILIDTGSLTGENKIGEFESLVDITSYWSSSVVGPYNLFPVYDSNYNRKATDLKVTYSRNILNDAMQLDSLASYTQGDFAVIKLRDNYFPKFYKDDKYVVALNASVKRDNVFKTTKAPATQTKVPDGWVDVYVSGSAFDSNTTLTADNIQTNALGKYIGSVYINDGALVLDKVFAFEADQDGTGTVLFAVRSGNVYLSNIHVYPETTIGKSPSRIRLQLPVPTISINAEQQFKFQYFDYQGNPADYTTEVFGPVFAGGNTYIEGDQNVLTGSLSVGGGIGSGLDIVGDIDYGWLGLHGYDGYQAAVSGTGDPGVGLWSGSRTLGTTTYNGLGFELASSDVWLRFKAETGQSSSLDIKGSTIIADKFIYSNGLVITSSYWTGSDEGTISRLSDVKVSGSFYVTGSTNVVGTHTITGSSVFNGTLRLDPTIDPTSTFFSSSFLFVSQSNTSLGYDMYVRQDGNIVKWKWIEANLNTGILYGGVLTYSGSEFYISPGTGIIVNHNATTGSEVNPQIQYVSWNSITQSIASGSQNSYVYIDAAGAAHQQTSFFTTQQYHYVLPIGRISHYGANSTTITGVGNNVITAYDQTSQFAEFVRGFGPLKLNGFGISAHVGTLGFALSSGVAYNLGGYYQYTPDSPSTYTSNAYATSSIIRIYRSGSGYNFDNNAGAYYTAIDPTKWDDGSGTLASVGNSEWTIQRVFVNPISGRSHIYYSQTTPYTTLQNALQSLTTDTFTESEVTINAYVFAAYLIVRGNTTDLSDTANNTILGAGLFRNTSGGGGGGGAASTLEDLTDVNITSPINGQTIIYQTGLWVNGYPATSSYALSASSFTETDPIFVAKSASLATTGSNIFKGNQFITGSAYITGALSIGDRIVAASASRDLNLLGTNAVIRLVRVDPASNNAPSIELMPKLHIDSASSGYWDMYVEPDDGSLRFRDRLVGTAANRLILSGSLVTVSASMIVTGSVTAPAFTGSLFGTSSWAQNAISSSYAISSSFATTASYALNAMSASFATTASYVNPLRQNVIVTGSVSFASSSTGTVWSMNTDGASIKFYNTGDGDTDSRLEFQTLDNNNEYFRWTHNSGGTTYESMRLVPNGANNATLTLSGSMVVSQDVDIAGDISANSYTFGYNGPAATVSMSRNAIPTSLYKTGRALHVDPNFSTGLNDIVRYNNSGGGAVTVSRVSASAEGLVSPAISNGDGYSGSANHILKIAYVSGSTTPGLGGWTFQDQAVPNATIVTVFKAWIPTGYIVNWSTNSPGTGYSTKWLTQQSGSGKWEDYVFMLQCGPTGSFGTTNFFYLTTPTPTGASFNWYLADANSYIISDSTTKVIPRLGVGTKTPLEILDVDGISRLQGEVRVGDLSSNFAAVEIGHGRTASGYAYLDLIGDTTYTDYGFRIIRNNTGADASTILAHRGTGSLSIATQDTASMQFITQDSFVRMFISSSGNVGIGTTTPSSKLHILGNAGILNLEGTDHAYMQWYPDGFAAGRKGWIGYGSSGDDNLSITNQTGSGGLMFRTNDTDRVFISSSGNVGINTITPAVQLVVSGSIQIGSKLSSSGLYTYAGGEMSTASGNYSFIHSYSSSIAGGTGNSIVGGVNNRMYYQSSFPNYSFIGGGGNHKMTSISYAGIVAGYGNSILGSFYESYEFIGGGYYNTIFGSPSSVIIGGYYNRIGNGANDQPNNSIIASYSSSIITTTGSSIIAGTNNNISNTRDSIIIGGVNNNLSLSTFNSIVGGESNTVSDGSGSSILGGAGNQIIGHSYSSIIGGVDNLIDYGAALSNGSEAIMASDLSTVTNVVRGAIIGGYKNKLYGVLSAINNSVILGGTGITGSVSNTVYTPNLIVTGSLTVGASSMGPSENTLTLGARDVTNEGGQIGFNAPGGTYTSASMIDNYQNQFRILKGTNAGSTTAHVILNLHNGNFGIGITPTKKLDVSGDARIGSIPFTGNSRQPLYYEADGALVANSSDNRFKINISTLSGSLDKVNNLRGVTFNWINQPSGSRSVGFIAQEVEAVIPELVFTDQNSPEQYKGVYYAEMTALLVEAVKTLSAENESLKSELQAIKTHLGL